MTLRVAVVTGGRADYGLLHPLLSRLHDDPRFDLRLIVTGSHLSEAHGMTVQDVEADGFPIAERVTLPLEDGTRLGVACATGIALADLAQVFARLTPDVLVVLGDRYETFAAAAAATALLIPIAHIHGGELTYGAIDDAYRHAVTKMATIHFAATAEYRRRIIQMGETPDTVFDVGALAVDNVLKLSSLTPQELTRRFGVECGRDCLLVTFHPASAGNDSQAQLAQLLKALDRLTGLRVVFTGSNADAEGAVLTRTVREYAESHPERAAFVMSFGREAYLAAAKGCAAVVGNSSSGVIEVPVLGIPSVDIGDRQSGRIHPASVVHSEPDAESIQRAVELAISDDFRASASVAPNPYGDGHAAERMVEVLARLDRNSIPAAKRFFDIDIKGCTDAS